ncbi:MarR family winged helix-turn-helix transcriptional regulator [Nocardia sp. NPDC046763]|uniref:MarR family winged helix-turn-helix transcriptional regulator n=1 Tax=Nocardia sp. NPDC046763 TaxID=3155256 RepID=UPI0033EF7BC2
MTNPLADRLPPLGNLLAAAARRLAAELDAGIAAAGFEHLRAAHAPVFQVIDPQGSRQTELAARTGMTKQAVGELIRHLEAHGYVTVAPDPSDGRARMVTLTALGWRVVEAGSEVIARFDAALDETIGHAEVTRLRATLTTIIGGAGSTYSAGHTEPTTVLKASL